VRGRGALKKTLIAIAAEEDGDKIGRIRLRRVRDASADSLQAFIDDSIEPGSLTCEHSAGEQAISVVGSGFQPDLATRACADS
jgi:hypothetical protein